MGLFNVVDPRGRYDFASQARTVKNPFPVSATRPIQVAETLLTPGYRVPHAVENL